MKKLLNYHPSKWEALSFLLIPIFIGLLTSTGNENDLWFLLNTGRYILNYGFPTVDPFTIHEGLSLVVQQWIPDVLFYTVFNSFGEIGLYILVNLVNVFIVLITYKLLMLMTDNKRNLSVMFTTVITTLISMSFIVSRPQIFSISFLITELYILEYYFITKKRKILLVLPILSVLMINFHASMWLLLFCFLVPFIFDTFSFRFGKLVSNGGNKKDLILIGIIMGVCGFINPYGIDAMTYVLTSYGIPIINACVGEMLAPDIATIRGKASFIVIFLVYLIYFLFLKKKINIRHFLLLIGTTYLALSSYRGIVFFIIASIYPLAFYFKNNFYYIKDKNNLSPKLVYIFLFLIFVLVPFFVIIKNDLIITDFPMKSGINYILENEDVSEVKLYCNYGECNYAEYMGIKVYLDSRAEVFLKDNNHKEDILKEYYLLQHHAIYYKNFIDKYNFTHLLVKETDVLYQNLLHDDNYEVVYEGYETKADHKIGKASMDRWNYILFKKVDNK